jgi:DNA-binding XRE family transcriptional regulator
MELVPIRCRLPELLKGRSQQWLADQTGHSKQRISDYTNMRYIMSLKVAANIAHILRVRIDDLYEWEWQQE